MADLVPILSALLAGVFAVITGYLTWRQKRRADAQDRTHSLAKERREELKRLYSDVYVLVEQQIKSVRSLEPALTGNEFSEVNARVHLLAPEAIVEAYSTVFVLLDEWATLHANASPRRMKVGEETVVLLQAPDPTEKYKEPAQEAHEKLQDAVAQLIEAMRASLERDA